MSVDERTTDDIQTSLTQKSRLFARNLMLFPVVMVGALTAYNAPYENLLASTSTGLVMLSSMLALTCGGAGVMNWLGRVINGQTREEVEGRAANLSRKMTIPMLICIVPTMFLAVLGPSIIKTTEDMSSREIKAFRQLVQSEKAEQVYSPSGSDSATWLRLIQSWHPPMIIPVFLSPSTGNSTH